jgi:hypothetical protein
MDAARSVAHQISPSHRAGLSLHFVSPSGEKNNPYIFDYEPPPAE